MIFDFLQKVPLFADLPEEDLLEICKEVEEVSLPKGEQLFAEGDQGDKAYVIQEGELEVVVTSADREVLLAVHGSGEVIGEMALLQESPRTATVRARSDSLLLAVRKEQLDSLLSNSISAVNAIFRVILERLHENEALMRQSEKMAQLGTLTAGVAHELNNPAAAVKRGADQLQESLSELEHVYTNLSRAELSEDQRSALADLAGRSNGKTSPLEELDPIARSDKEEEIADWLEDHGVDDGWELASGLVELDFDTDSLATITESFEEGQLGAVVQRLSAGQSIESLLKEIGEGAGRISEIVKSLKTYSYLDQAPVQSVDLHEGLDSTLTILRGKLQGIKVKREYNEDLPHIQAYGSELNQVWTNILDNAADAVDGSGNIVIRTRQESQWAIVEIEDDGPGIPEDIQSKIFDTFFTTKPPGKGTGLGLDISYNIIVQKHRGDIKVTSEPGRTCFQVWLPTNLETS